MAQPKGKKIVTIQYTMKKTHIAVMSVLGLFLLAIGIMSDKNWLAVIGIILTIVPIVIFVSIIKAMKKASKWLEEAKKNDSKI